MSKKVLLYRLGLLLVCLCVFGISFYRMNQSFDPLARYLYAQTCDREKILAQFSSDDIDYIITQQLPPETFEPFMDCKGFTLRYTMYYYEAKTIQDRDNEYIVNFVNRFKPYFSLDLLASLLTHYSYVDLTTFYENELLLHEDMELVADPTYPYLLLDQNLTVYKYVPDDLVALQNVSIKKVAADAFNEMNQGYQSVFEGRSLQIESGYLSYDQISNLYLELSSLDEVLVDRVISLAGQDEMQLGYTIALKGAYNYSVAALNLHQEQLDVESLYANFDEETIEMIDWLEENAYRYGFVCRYVQDNENNTHRWPTPFVYRYVGTKTAKQMHDEGKTFEDMSFTDELE